MQENDLKNFGLTVFDLKKLKGKRKIKFVQIDTLEQGLAAKKAGIEMIGTSYEQSKAHFPQQLKGVHFQFGLKWGNQASGKEALRASMKAMNDGAQSIYCPMSPSIIEVLSREGIPIIAHAGLIPPKITLTGGYRAVGKSFDEAKIVWETVKRYESAGAFAIELEVVPGKLANEITQRTSLFTISLGSGSKCDAQYLFSADILGEKNDFLPRHAKRYKTLFKEHDRIQNERVDAYKKFVKDVDSNLFEDKKYSVSMDDKVLNKLINFIDKNKLDI